MNSISCSYQSICSGCDLLAKTYSEQKTLKIDHLIKALGQQNLDLQKLPDIEWTEIAEAGLRDRADLIYDARSGSRKLGLFAADRSGVVDLESCPQMSPALEAWLMDFRKISIPIQRGSIRLRVSPSGIRGVWLDFANIDVKSLLEERTTLDQLRAVSIVEIGQRRKRLVERDGQLKLTDPVLEPWFETYIHTGTEHEQSIPLYCTIGSFTQPGFRANRGLITALSKMIRETRASHAVEFGSGIGNLTFPLAAVSSCNVVDAYEVDHLALIGLRKSLSEFPLPSKIEVNEGNFQSSKKSVDFTRRDLILVDPPRSGLMNFITPLEKLDLRQRPEHFIYVSCFAESFAEDVSRLETLGYQIRSLNIVDQFPQSRHYEVLAHLAL